MGLNRMFFWLAITVLAAAPEYGRGADESDQRPRQGVGATTARGRSKVWQALLKAWPYKENKIDLYAENPSSTEVCFRSRGQTYLFTLRTGKAQLVEHAKVIAPDINCITFEKGNRGLGAFILWHYGDAQLSIGGDP
jgi:hypothetical protein